MLTIITVIHVLIAIAMVGVILMQRSEGGALGIGGGSGGGMGGIMSGRGTANLLTRTTAVLAAMFIATSIILAILVGGKDESGSILDQPVQQQAPAAPAQPEGPAVPQSD
ncbi:preprotein translocase subunit SecG [Minwuia thermotolerans]|uniref:Protein-export membrane protein SecG n=1 Tax=Minwuia thermotolerans TaxID=2056226 RepID=A0A2M9G1C7_9PROT|nr:preprotein translocase subunit SecG [Minwuia thermotolerans]PJK29520.1 preprotein translocase subunit SecG [Minwuia thermotolerans]